MCGRTHHNKLWCQKENNDPTEDDIHWVHTEHILFVVKPQTFLMIQEYTRHKSHKNSQLHEKHNN